MTAPSRRFAIPLLVAVALGTVAQTAADARAQTCPLEQHCFCAPPLMPNPTGFSGTGWDLVLASPNGTITGTYTVGAGAPTAFSVTSGAPLKVVLSASQGAASAYAAVEARGLFIAASRPDLSVVQRFVVGPWNSSAAIKEASSSLGDRFRAGGYVLDRVSNADSGHDVVSICAPFGATVTVDPPGSATNFWGDGCVGDARTVTLGVGQTVLWRTNALNSCGNDITGALITADAPVSVITGGRGWAGSCGPHSTGGCGGDGQRSLRRRRPSAAPQLRSQGSKRASPAAWGPRTARSSRRPRAA